jgi:hypothetical protein
VRQAILLLASLAQVIGAQQTSWSIPVELGLPDSLSLRAPSVVVVGDTTIAAGNVFPKDVDQFIGRRRLAIVRSPGGMLPIPAGSFDFAFPHLARDSRGALHLVWAELADSTGSFAAWTRPPISLWHSVFSNARWSSPNKILSGRTINWAADGRPMIVDSKGTVHIAVPALLPAADFAVVYLRIDAAGSLTEHDFTPGAGYASITQLSGDSLLIAYSTSDGLTPKGGSSILARVSGDGGRTWDPPLPIARSARRNASPPLLESTPTGLIAFWVDDARNADEPQTLRAFSTRTPSAAWVEITPPYSLEGVLVRLVSAGTPCGSYAIVAEILSGTANDPTIRLVDVAARDGRLTGTALFPDFATATSVGIGADRDRLRLMFSALRRNEQRGISATATGRACRTM